MKTRKYTRKLSVSLIILCALLFAGMGGSLILLTEAAPSDGNLTITTSQQIGSIKNPPANETSGVAMFHGLYVVHNDSGGLPELYAFKPNGDLVATIKLTGAAFNDWEDLEIITNSDGTGDVYVADIGDNAKARTSVRVHRVDIPQINSATLNQTINATNLRTYNMTYTDGPRDAEGLAVHPITKQVFVISKQSTGSGLYSAGATLSTSSSNTLNRLATIPVNTSTAASISADGKYLVITPYSGGTGTVYRLPSSDVAAAISDNNKFTFTAPSMTQLEAVTFTPDAKHIVFATESGSANPPIWAMPNPAYAEATPPPSGQYKLRDSLSVGMNAHLMYGSMGVNPPYMDDTIRKLQLDYIKELGTDWVRMDVGWSTFEEKGKGTGKLSGSSGSKWYYDRLNFVLNEANARGIKVLVTLANSPPWARTGCSDPSDYRCAPDNPQDYADFAGWFATEFGEKVAAIEVWNEPNHNKFMIVRAGETNADKPAIYAGILKAAYPKIKQAKPNLRVVGGALADNDKPFLEALYNQGIKGYFDTFAVHPYNSPANDPPETAWQNKTNPDWYKYSYSYAGEIIKLMDQKGDTNKDLWFTEFSWSAHDNTGAEQPWELGVTEFQQGDYWIRALKMANELWPRVTNTFWYQLHPYPGSSVQETNHAIMNADYSKKQAFDMMKTFLAASYRQPASMAADYNKDGKVDIYDLTMLLGKWNMADTSTDLNNDNVVNVFDLSILLSKWTI